MASPFTPDQVAWLQTTFSSATIPLRDIAASTESGWSGDCRLSFRHSSGDTPSLSVMLPTFSSAVGTNAGLQLLASASAKAGVYPLPLLLPQQSTMASSSGLSSRGPYNPTAVLPPKIAKKILGLEYVEMAEISLDDHPPPTHARSATSAGAASNPKYLCVD